MTPTSQRVYDAIAHLEARLGYGPSIREIGQEAGLSSSSSVHRHLQLLMRAGLIRRATSKQGYRTVERRVS